ncbi:ORF6N domain-containing protein [Candidatus Peregrinibacteria bacterium]|nr:ORF6N domain-containing protein [Candidatus Peregrinibacteria bacterium]
MTDSIVPASAQALAGAPIEHIESIIYVIRGNKVMLDRDLAALYGVETKKLIQAVKRNMNRFPKDFMFQLSKGELENWKSQIVTSNFKIKMGLRKLPFIFTEQGVAMLSSVLRSSQAVSVNIEIMRAFTRLRQALTSRAEVAKELDQIKEFALRHSHETSREFRRVWKAIEKLSNPPVENRRIGFDLSR